jgi:hypothetical protein
MMNPQPPVGVWELGSFPVERGMHFFREASLLSK